VCGRPTPSRGPTHSASRRGGEVSPGRPIRYVRSHPTAGQATLEYLAAIALLAAVFVVAAPAVGAPDIGRKVVAAVKHGICIAGGDICTSGDARRAGLAPCPLKSDTTGAEGSVTAFSVELGGKWTLTATPQSDGTVAVVRSAAASTGVTGGPSAGANLGPVVFEAGGDGALRARVVVARGWTFRDAAAAKRFLQHSVRHAFDDERFPWAWQSGEYASEVSGSAKVAAGVEGVAGGDLVGVSVSGQGAIGLRKSREGTSTTYTRIALAGPDVTVPFAPSVGRGRNDWIAEFTRDASGPRELVFRTAVQGDLGDQLTETVARLDLRDPANLEVARPLLDSPQPWSAVGGAGKQAVMDRIATHGVVERTVSAVDDDSSGASAGIKALLKFSVSGKRVKIHKRLVQATARLGTALDRRRLDCIPAAR
jgi:hypothetical protein